MNVAIETDGGKAGQTLARISSSVVERRPLNAALGKRGEVELREHFRERNQEPNKSGFPKADFWSRIRKSTALSAIDADGATISIADPAIVQKIFGGEITPKEGKYLTLPAIAAAYGKSPRSFTNLELLFRWMNGARRAVALVERAATRLKGAGKGEVVGGQVFFWLVTSVRQKRDPRALPDRAEFEAALVEEAGDFVADLTR